MRKVLVIFIFAIITNTFKAVSLNHKIFNFKYGVSIKAENVKIKSLEIYLPLPATTRYQKLINFKCNVKKYKILKSSKHVARYLYFKFKNPEKLKRKIHIIISAKVKKRKRNLNLKKIISYKTSYKNYNRRFKNNAYINTGHKTVKSIAGELKGASVYYMIKYLIKRLNSLIKRKSRFLGLRKLKNILKKRDGECSDYVSVFVSVMRKLKIPARHVVGRIITLNLKKSWHTWAEVYIKNHGWVSVDPFYHTAKKPLIGYQPLNYIAYHKGILLPSIKKDYNIPMLQSFFYRYTYENNPGKIKMRYIWINKKT